MLLDSLKPQTALQKWHDVEMSVLGNTHRLYDIYRGNHYPPALRELAARVKRLTLS